MEKLFLVWELLLAGGIGDALAGFLELDRSFNDRQTNLVGKGMDALSDVLVIGAAILKRVFDAIGNSPDKS